MSTTGTRVDGRSRRAEAARDRRRTRILETALKLFAERGYHATHVSDIIDAAGVARGTFYLYFESKEAIFHALLDRLLAHLRAHVVGVDTTPGAPPVERQLQQTVRRLLEVVERERRAIAVVLREAVGLDPSVDAKLREFYASLHAYVVEALVAGQAMGIVRPLDVEIAAACILGSIKHVMERAVMLTPEAPLPIERVCHAVLDFNLRGVLADGAAS
ncbi:MAG: TetR/AcrR family transcriptional regulator [Myxococcota bacterium]|nr:TetR/AcrR family transcriptional regulator [Myxococcota bacterium]